MTRKRIACSKPHRQTLRAHKEDMIAGSCHEALCGGRIVKSFDRDTHSSGSSRGSGRRAALSGTAEAVTGAGFAELQQGRRRTLRWFSGSVQPQKVNIRSTLPICLLQILVHRLLTQDSDASCPPYLCLSLYPLSALALCQKAVQTSLSTLIKGCGRSISRETKRAKIRLPTHKGTQPL